MRKLSVITMLVASGVFTSPVSAQMVELSIAKLLITELQTESDASANE